MRISTQAEDYCAELTRFVRAHTSGDAGVMITSLLMTAAARLVDAEDRTADLKKLTTQAARVLQLHVDRYASGRVDRVGADSSEPIQCFAILWTSDMVTVSS
jgi:hypothetical protein